MIRKLINKSEKFVLIGDIEHLPEDTIVAWKSDYNGDICIAKRGDGFGEDGWVSMFLSRKRDNDNITDGLEQFLRYRVRHRIGDVYVFAGENADIEFFEWAAKTLREERGVR